MTAEDDSTDRKEDDAPTPAQEGAQPDGTDAQDANAGPLRNEYDGEGEKDGIPANGTRPVKPQGPEDFGGDAWGEGV